ncbi:MAG: bifunctional demethylmenaquinone methyltransferase/2-methoxy-6-polyprenyl-1,4-benzoquinol methylase UbiE [Pseudomonadota bacterium]
MSKIKNPESVEFGTKSVTPEEKTTLVRGVFDSVADQYDVMNDLMSGGIHRGWKNHLIRRIRPKSNQAFLDVAGGTGDIAFRIRRKTGANTKITLCDLNWDMLRVGRDRAVDKGWLNDFEWITGNAEKRPVPDESYDVYTISFGLRNVTRIDDALKEAYRVLKPGGRFYCLEFSTVENPLISKIYDGFSYNIIPKIGKAVANDEDSYQYLVESIRKFPSQENLKTRMEQVGFAKTSYENLTFGVAAIHFGIKL